MINKLYLFKLHHQCIRQQFTAYSSFGKKKTSNILYYLQDFFNVTT